MSGDSGLSTGRAAPIEDLKHGFKAKLEQDVEPQGIIGLLFSGRHNGRSAFRVRTIRSRMDYRKRRSRTRWLATGRIEDYAGHCERPAPALESEGSCQADGNALIPRALDC